jgi:putative transposase
MMRTSYKAERPLQIVVVDHVKVDALVFDAGTYERLRAPWLTIAIDAFTRMAMGFHLAMNPPSRVSVSMCLLQSVCGKGRWLSERGIDGIWPIAGVPETLRLDAQSFYGLRDFGRICAKVEIETVSSSTREQAYGAHVEALIGTRIGDVPLATERSLGARRSYDWPERVREHYETLPELERHLARQIVQRYHFQWHQALKRAPIEVWREYENEVPLRAPANCLKFRLSFMPEEDCELEGDGLWLLGRKYSSPGLGRHFREGLDRAVVKYDPRDLSYAFVETPSGRYIRVYELNGVANNAEGSHKPCGSDDVPRSASDGFTICGDAASAVSIDVMEKGLEGSARERASIGGRKRDGAVEFNSIELIERRCASSCPFQRKSRQLIVRECLTGDAQGSN